MCRLKVPSGPSASAAQPTPQKTDLGIQLEAEAGREKEKASTRGFAATLLTAGLGDTTKIKTTRGVTLGGF
jgi:hypothetical protein